MAEPSLQGAAEIFDPLRPRLMRVAYRMLGSVSDAEDVVQEAFIRWMGVDREEIREPDQHLVNEALFWVAFLRRQRGEVPESSPALKDALERAAQIGKAPT